MALPTPGGYNPPMGILERLGTAIKSYLNYDEFQRGIRMGREDPDLDAAYEELDDYLRGDSTRKAAEEKPPRPIPEEVRRSFAELGLGPEASPEECKEAYKRLLKIHHPDRHTRHQENMKKATEKSARVNAAYEILMKWFKELP